LIGINAAGGRRAYNPGMVAKFRYFRSVGLIIAGTALLAACASQPVGGPPAGPGFLAGLLHGFFALPALIGSLFFPWRVYAFPNSGFGYELGFVLGFGSSNILLMLSLIARIGGMLVRKS
jgi:hypothetical protein